MTSASVILVAEDNDDDFVLLRCAFESAGMSHRLIGVPNGADAINYLSADEPFTNRSAYPFPDLLLLDLQMPVMDGMEVLASIKGRIEFCSLPVVVLSALDDPRIIREALSLGARGFLIKPVTGEERIDMVRALHARWLNASSSNSMSDRGAFNPWLVRLPDAVPDSKNKRS